MYSILLAGDTAKNTANGVNHSQKKKLRHETNNNVHEGVVNCAIATCINIRLHHNVLHTVTTKEVALIKVERKRCWFDKVCSLAFDQSNQQ